MTQQPVDNCAALPDGPSFPPLIELAQTDSTNNYALQLLRQGKLTEGQAAGTGIFAHEQWAGKGQRGRSWLSKAGENIHLSTIIDARSFSLDRQFLLVVRVALAVSRFLEKYAAGQIRIKWPNDLYFQDRKAGGILIENIISGNNWKWAVAGTGLNINQTAFDASIAGKAISLRQLTGRHYDCLQLARELRDSILKTATIPESEEDLLNAYHQRLYKKDQNVLLRQDDRIFEATVKGVLATGQLEVFTDRRLLLDFGTVSWLA